MENVHTIVEKSVRNSVAASRLKPISYEKLLPYTINTLRFLVACAQKERLPTYQEVTNEIRAGSAQNANRGFSSIIRILNALTLETKFSGLLIPDITTIVRNTGKQTSGPGIFKRAELENKKPQEKQAWLLSERIRVFDFKKWDLVLSFLGLKPMRNLVPPQSSLEEFDRVSSKLRGKSQEHQSLQDWIENHPVAAGLFVGETIRSSHQEYLFWSLDRLDILFQTDKEWIGVEVKPSSASDQELQKGMYQVMKYRALIDATLLAEGAIQSCRCVLVIGGALPSSLRPLANRFQIDVIENATRTMSKAKLAGPFVNSV
jgi:hypothetical protein